jgi:mono/diheme cytochrome c family protein
MRLALSLALAGACAVMVLLSTARTARGDDQGDQRNCPTPPAFDTTNHGEDNGNEIEGRRIYMRENCYICHGGFAGGGMCPSLREPKPDYEKTRQCVRFGTRNGMPQFPELTDQDIRNLATYFQTLRTCREPTFTHWWEPVPTQ